jgi:hypothetical protein
MPVIGGGTAVKHVLKTLRQRFPNSTVQVETPAVIIPFGSTRSERHEIIPADYINSLSGFNVYQIPNRAGGVGCSRVPSSMEHTLMQFMNG